jgi:hypothetical protein
VGRNPLSAPEPARGGGSWSSHDFLAPMRTDGDRVRCSGKILGWSRRGQELPRAGKQEVSLCLLLAPAEIVCIEAGLKSRRQSRLRVTASGNPNGYETLRLKAPLGVLGWFLFGSDCPIDG